MHDMPSVSGADAEVEIPGLAPSSKPSQMLIFANEKCPCALVCWVFPD